MGNSLHRFAIAEKTLFGLIDPALLLRINLLYLLLAGIRKKRLRTAAIRRGPYSGWDLFTPTIRFLTASVSLGRAPGGSLGTSPSAPCCRYAFTQRFTEWLLTPNFSLSTEGLYPFSRYRLTIFN